MLAFLANFRDLCLFRRGPEDMPYAPWLLVGLLVGCMAVLVGVDLHAGVQPALAAGSVVGGLADLGLVLLILKGRGKRERFVQTATALAAVYFAFGVAKGLAAWSLPIKQWRHQWLTNPEHLPTATGHESLLAFLVAVFAIWQICVWASSLRRSLEIPAAGGVLVLLGLFFASVTIAVIVAGIIGVA